MVLFLSLFNGVCLGLIALIHFYWSFGGRFGVAHVVPTLQKEQKPQLPPPFLTFIVAVVFLVFACLFFQTINFISLFTSKQLKIGILITVIIFLARAIGDFKYVGFFKKIKETPFAIKDTKYYSPLILVLGIFSLLIFYWNYY